MGKTRGCRGRPSKRRHREVWLARIGAEFVSNSHQEGEDQKLDEMSSEEGGVAAGGAAEEPLGSRVQVEGAATTLCGAALRSVKTPCRGEDGAAGPMGWGYAHLLFVAAFCGAVVLLALAVVGAGVVVTCGIVACGGVSWWRDNTRRKELQVAAAVAKVKKFTKKRAEKIKATWGRVLATFSKSGAAGPVAMFRALWEEAEAGRLEEKRLRMAEGMEATQNLLRVRSELTQKQMRLQVQVREAQAQFEIIRQNLGVLKADRGATI